MGLSKVIVLGNKTQGHDACPPTPWQDNLSTLTFVGSKPVVLLNSRAASHGCKDHSSHMPVLIEASSIVFSEGRGFARVGDVTDCGDKVLETTDLEIFTV